MGTAPYGTWRSRLAAAHLVEQAVGLGHVATACGDVYWSEARPSESGREVIVRRGREGAHHDVVPAGFSARSTVHEYGGRCYTVVRASLWFANADDQRLYRCPAEPGAAATAVTPPPATPRGVRFADLSSTPDERWVLAVRETHGGGEPANDLVALPVDAGEGRVHTVAAGHDFVAAPRVSPDGSQLAWLSWDHPNMPWDGTELWVAPFGPDARVGAARLVAGGRAESISQPRWSPDGRLHFLSDRNGWWNLYVDDGRGGRPLAPRAAELCGPDWALGESSYVFLPDGRLVATWSSGGFGHLGVLEGDELVEVPTPYCAFSSLAALDGGVAAVAGSPTEEPAVVRIDVASGSAEVLRRSRPPLMDPGDVSAPVAIEFPSEGGRTAHALFYRPAHRDTTGPDGERPPLVVTCHGGPTGAASPVLDLGVQFWTNRGLAVAAVDYGGSAGYGRPYRELLRGAWGIVDVDDCVAAARWLADRGEVDGRRMVIRGRSAGGFTALAALTFRDVFAAAASHYGIADLAALARDSHKFESHYLDSLVGPWPAAEAAYRARSPVHHVDLVDRPLILFQGLEDPIVPPAQAEAMAGALRARGVPVAFLAFEGERHGFRRADTVVAVAEAELSFYGQVLGFEPADAIQPVHIEPLPIERAGAPPAPPAR